MDLNFPAIPLKSKLGRLFYKSLQNGANSSEGILRIVVWREEKAGAEQIQLPIEPLRAIAKKQNAV